MRRSKLGTVVVYFFLIMGVVMIILPLYMTIITAFKTTAENTSSFFALPKSLNFSNFTHVLEGGKYFKALLNTFYITVFVVIGNALIMPAMSYAISRSMGNNKFYKYIYYFLLLGIFVPFQVKMMPLVKLMAMFNMLNPTGLIVLCIASSTCEAVFLFVGYLHSVPLEMEQAAYIDGATTFQTYTHIVFPLLRPILATVVIKNALWTWNDFLLPLVTLNRSWKHWTITLFQYNFRTEYSIDYSSSFAVFCMSMIPIIALFIFMQRHIIGGLTSGAIKN